MSVLSDCSKMIISSVLDNNHLERDDYILSKVEQLKPARRILKDVSGLIVYMPLSSGVNMSHG